MAEKALNGDYIRLSNVTCWMDPKTSEIHVTFNDSDLHHDKTGDGGRVVFNSNTKSANYHPANYNRFGDALRTHGCTAPAGHVEEGPRRIDKRFRAGQLQTPSRRTAAASAQLGPWFCDTCDEPITDPADGYVLWDRRENGPGGYRVIHQGRCDDDTYRSSMPLDDFLGSDGLTYLLSFLSIGPIKRSLGEHNMSVRDMDALVDFVRRTQIPGYEQARRLYGDPEVRQSYADATESYPYRQESIDSILRSKGQRGPNAR